MIPNSSNPSPARGRGKLVALVGTLAAAGLLSLTSGFEGTVLKTDRDLIARRRPGSHSTRAITQPGTPARIIASTAW